MTALDLQPSSLWVILWPTGRCPCYPKEPAVAHQGKAEAGDSPDAFTPGRWTQPWRGRKRSEGLGAPGGGGDLAALCQRVQPSWPALV